MQDAGPVLTASASRQWVQGAPATTAPRKKSPASSSVRRLGAAAAPCAAAPANVSASAVWLAYDPSGSTAGRLLAGACRAREIRV